MSQHLSPRYGHVILVSGYPVIDHNMHVQYQVTGSHSSHKVLHFTLVSLWCGRTGGWTVTYHGEISKFSPLWGCARVKHCYNCLKLKGFYPFADIDECRTNIDSCDVHASCNNTIGSHNCTCNSGFYGSGQECLGKINC